MYLRMDEEVGSCWSLSRAALDGFACSMLITQALDFWRIWIGPIVDPKVAREFAIKMTPPHLIGKIQPPQKEQSVPFVY